VNVAVLYAASPASSRVVLSRAHTMLTCAHLPLVPAAKKLRFAEAEYFISATPYSEKKGLGVAGRKLELHLLVTDKVAAAARELVLSRARAEAESAQRTRSAVGGTVTALTVVGIHGADRWPVLGMFAIHISRALIMVLRSGSSAFSHMLCMFTCRITELLPGRNYTIDESQLPPQYSIEASVSVPPNSNASAFGFIGSVAFTVNGARSNVADSDPFFISQSGCGVPAFNVHFSGSKIRTEQMVHNAGACCRLCQEAAAQNCTHYTFNRVRHTCTLKRYQRRLTGPGVLPVVTTWKEHVTSAYVFRPTAYRPQAGSYVVTAQPFGLPKATGAQGTPLTARFTVIKRAPFSVTSLSLSNAKTNSVIKTMVDGENIILSEVDQDALNIEARVAGDNKVPFTGSVVFSLNDQPRLRVDNTAPYNAFALSKGVFRTWFPSAGFYVVTATAYSQADGKGVKSSPFQIRFSVFNTRAEMQETTDPVAFSTETRKFAVEGLILVDAVRGVDIRELHDGDVLNVKQLPAFTLRPKFNTPSRLREGVENNAMKMFMGSVRYGMNGRSAVRTLNHFPFLFQGNSKRADGTLKAWTPAAGAYVFNLVSFSSKHGKGEHSASFQLRLNVVSDDNTVGFIPRIRVERVHVVNASSGAVVQTLRRHDAINLATLPTNWSLVAQLSPGEFTGSLVWGIDSNTSVAISNSNGAALQLVASNLTQFTVGRHALRLTIFTRADGTGVSVHGLVYDLTLVNGTAVPKDLNGLCYAWGAGHISTFDNRVYSFGNGGHFAMVQSGAGETYHQVELQRWRPDKVGYVRGVTFRVGSGESQETFTVRLRHPRAVGAPFISYKGNEVKLEDALSRFGAFEVAVEGDLKLDAGRRIISVQANNETVVTVCVVNDHVYAGSIL